MSLFCIVTVRGMFNDCVVDAHHFDVDRIFNSDTNMD